MNDLAPTRTCSRCPADISHRRASAIYCVACAYTAHVERKRAGYRPRSSPRPKRTCAACPTDITHRAAQTRHCAACAAANDRAQRLAAAERHATRKKSLEAQAQKLLAEVKLGTLGMSLERAVSWLLVEAVKIERERCLAAARRVAESGGGAWVVAVEIKRGGER